MRRLPRWLVFTLVVLVLASGALASISVGTTRQSFPEIDGQVDVAGLNDNVEVLRDAYGVPHVYADTAEDLFAAQGFVNAQDRFYEMDFRRHLASGRLSELYGESQVETDAYIRTLGWRRVAEAELALLAPSTRRFLDAYASGVNAYLTDRNAGDLSLEYSLLAVQGLDYEPQPWTAVDSLAWTKVMAWDLGSNLQQESERAILTGSLGAARATVLYPSYPREGHEPIVGRGTVVDGAFDPDARRRSAGSPSGLAAAQLRGASGVLEKVHSLNGRLPELLGSRRSDTDRGSNSWVVAGSRTVSGAALLANDPHVATSMPSLLTQVGLHCRVQQPSCPFDVTGFSLTSLPGVVIGRNTSIAWGLTTSYLDVQDLFIEQVEGDTVREGEVFVPLTVRTEEIQVRGEDQPRLIRIRSSRHGPLLSDVDIDLQGVVGSRARDAAGSYAVALSWVASTPGRTLDALLGINQASNFDEFREAAALLSAPSQNLVYADTAGNIGYQLPGAAPRRGRGDGRTPSPGWDARYDWQGLIPFAELPFAYNPPGGFIVAANQPVIGRQYPYPLGSAFSYGWRSQEIVDRLRDAGPLTPDQAEQMFYDDTIRVAADLVPRLLRIHVADPWVLEGQQTMVGWDYSAASNSAAAAYYNVVFHNILKLTFRDELPEPHWPTGGDRWYAVVSDLLKQPRSPWWDDVNTADHRETRDDILLAALTNARKEITSLMARDVDEWQWGRIHTVTLRNQTLGQSGIRPVEALFNRGEFRVGGGPGVVNAQAYTDTLGYEVTTAPAMRMLVDLGDLDQSRWVNQSGASGHAFHRNYDDQAELWAGNRMWPFVSSRAAVEARTTDRLELVPAG